MTTAAASTGADRLAGRPRTALATGGSKGIGAEVVRAMAARGLNVG